ncbi:MAG TPA: carbohydrate ABC transporter permease, partial [Clostridiales bacterium]|nr:carbohydrate ABC transporter permease [Clostridiales bacterium]
MSKYIKKFHILHHIPLILTVIILSFPLYLMLVISLKTEAEILKAPFALPQTIMISNYLNAAKQMNLWTILPNSII